MEEGSLLPIALDHARSLRGENLTVVSSRRRPVAPSGGGDDDDGDTTTTPWSDLPQKDCVVLDIFSVPHCCCDETQSKSSSSSCMDHLLFLAKLADRCNGYVQKQRRQQPSSTPGILWHYGGDGPVFGITATPVETTFGSRGSTTPKRTGRGQNRLIPHLRAICRYGPNIQDEWYAIELLRRLTCSMMEENSHDEGKEKTGGSSGTLLAGCAWDVEDGQVILIQLADLLPSWVDEAASSDRHRYACWFVDGHLQLLDTPHIDLIQAMSKLLRMTSNSSTLTVSSTHPSLDRAIKFWLELNSAGRNEATLSLSSVEQQVEEGATKQPQRHKSRNQRTPMVLPRAVALFLQDRPELLHTAIQAYCEVATTTSDASFLSQISDLREFDDWVWTNQTVSRTNYAMLRTVISIPHQPSLPASVGNDDSKSNNQISWMTAPDGIPSSINVQVRKKYIRQCRMDTTPHLRNAASFGVRVVVGLQYLATKNKQPSQPSLLEAIPSPGPLLLMSSNRPLKSLEQRVLFWTNIEKQYHHSSIASSSSNGAIMDSFAAGPNQSSIDLTYILKCPVYPEESQNWITLLSNPQTSLSDQVRYGLEKQRSNVDTDNSIEKDGEAFWMPQPDQVDDDSWMDLLMDPKSSSGNRPGVVDSIHDVDRLLERFQNFVMKDSSGIDGVEGTHSNPHTSSSTNAAGSLKTELSLEIRPRVFLNILHTVYKGEKLIFPKVKGTRSSAANDERDNFFYDEDYDLMEPCDDDGDDDDDDDDDDVGVGGRRSANIKKDGDLFNMRDIMAAMDSELNSRTESRKLDSNLDNDDYENDADETDRLNIGNSEDVHVLSNLLQSLEVSGGQSGPVLNMLKEMESTMR
jgi:hypothetical protein